MKNKFLTGLMRWGSVEGKMSYFQPYAPGNHRDLKELSRAKRLRKGTVWAGKSHFTPAMLPSASSLMLTWLLAVPLLWGGCETTTLTPEQQLPGLTTTGENTFGCLVNGEAWLPEGGNPFGPGTKLRASFHYPSNQLGVSATKDNDITLESISFELVLEEESNEVKNLNTAFFLDLDCSFLGVTHQLDTLSPHGFQVEFLELEEKIVSGTFYFTAISSECQEDTIVISEGRYDIKFAN